MIPPAGRTIRYDGSCCLNLRSITSALGVLSAPASPGSKITRPELGTILWFVETCVMSRRLLFDGTTPDKDVETARKQAEQFLRSNDLDLDIEAIGVDAQGMEILRHATSAMHESSFLIGEFRFEPLDKPVAPNEHDHFYSLLKDAGNAREAERNTRALEFVESRFRGSKCLAALIAGGPELIAAALRAYEKNPTEMPRVTGALINRFRLNYLNQLASSEKGAYAPDPNFEPLTKEHRRRFTEYVLREIVRQIGEAQPASLLTATLEDTIPYPPIGLYALMITKEPRPAALLTTALTKFKHEPDLQKVLWEQTQEGLRLRPGAKTLEEYHLAVDQKFFESFRRLDKEAREMKQTATTARTVRRYGIPAVLGAVAGAALAPYAAPLAAAAAAAGAAALQGIITTVVTIAMEMAKDVGVDVLSDRWAGDGINSYISQYADLKWDFANDPALRQPTARIADQVEFVFGRQLD